MRPGAAPAIGRTLVLQGVSSGGTTIEGQVQVSGGEVRMDNLTLDTSTEPPAGLHESALAVYAGGQVRGSDLVVRNGTVLLADGFESGDTQAWSATVS